MSPRMREPKLCRNPSVSLTAWEDRGPTRFIFVKIPNERGRYLRTSRCVIEVPCPHCKSVVGEPCKSGKQDIYTGSTHYMRHR